MNIEPYLIRAAPATEEAANLARYRASESSESEEVAETATTLPTAIGDDSDCKCLLANPLLGAPAAELLYPLRPRLLARRGRRLVAADAEAESIAAKRERIKRKRKMKAGEKKTHCSSPICPSRLL